MSALARLRTIAAGLDWESDPQNDGGYVAAVDTASLPTLREKLRVAGYEVSDSRDEEGRSWLWVLHAGEG